jgi:hypothetical protein
MNLEELETLGGRVCHFDLWETYNMGSWTS